MSSGDDAAEGPKQHGEQDADLAAWLKQRGDQPLVFLTGGTGFLGMETLGRLLERGDYVIALIRGKGELDATARLDLVLETLYEEPGRYRAQVLPVSGDITLPQLGLGENYKTIAREIDTIIHCAASVSFSLPLNEAREINVAGTAKVLDFARCAQQEGSLKQLIHLSTAFVAGRHKGLFREDQLNLGQSFRNNYERTKWESEQLVAQAVDLPRTIVRPSIVMGDSESGWTPSFNALYGPLRAFSRGLITELPANLEARVDIVSADYVSDATITLLDNRATGTFNLVAGPKAITVRQLIELAVGYIGRPAPKVTLPGGEGEEDTEEPGIFLPYFDIEVLFDDQNARTQLAPTNIQLPEFKEYFRKLIEYAYVSHWGKRSISKEKAGQQ